MATTANAAIEIAGTQTADDGFPGRAPTSQQLREPKTLALHPDGSVLVADSGNNRVLEFKPDGSAWHVLIGTGKPGNTLDENDALKTQLTARQGLKVPHDKQHKIDKILVADPGNGRILAVDRKDSSVEVFTDTGDLGFMLRSAEGTKITSSSPGQKLPTSSELDSPNSIAVTREGHVLIADSGNHRVLLITDEGMKVFAGSADNTNFKGEADYNKLKHPSGVTVRPDGHVAISDTEHHRVLLFAPDGKSAKVLAGTGKKGKEVSWWNAWLNPTVELSSPCGLTSLADNSVIITDTGNNRLIKVAQKGSISVPSVEVDSNGQQASLHPRESSLKKPFDVVAVDNGMIIADSGKNRILYSNNTLEPRLNKLVLEGTQSIRDDDDAEFKPKLYELHRLATIIESRSGWENLDPQAHKKIEFLMKNVIPEANEKENISASQLVDATLSKRTTRFVSNLADDGKTTYDPKCDGLRIWASSIALEILTNRWAQAIIGRSFPSHDARTTFVKLSLLHENFIDSDSAGQYRADYLLRAAYQWVKHNATVKFRGEYGLAYLQTKEKHFREEKMDVLAGRWLALANKWSQSIGSLSEDLSKSQMQYAVQNTAIQQYRETNKLAETKVTEILDDIDEKAEILLLPGEAQSREARCIANFISEKYNEDPKYMDAALVRVTKWYEKNDMPDLARALTLLYMEWCVVEQDDGNDSEQQDNGKNRPELIRD